jgi:hypothetical protein
MNSELIEALASNSNSSDAIEIAKWVVARFSKDEGAWKSQDPDLTAFQAAGTDENLAVRIVRGDQDVILMVRDYMDNYSTIEWATLMSCLVAEQQIRNKMMESVKDEELDADKQQRVYTLKCDLAEKLIEMRSRHSKLAQDIIGTGAVGNQAARLAAQETRKKVTPEGRSREAQ